MADNEAKNILTDIEVESVGLVPQGAVSIETDEDGNPTGANFFLLKAKEGTVPDDLVIEEVETQTEETTQVEDQQPATPTEPQANDEERTLFERFKNFLNRAEPVEVDNNDEGEPDSPEGNEAMAKSKDEPTAAELILKAQLEAIQQQHEANLEAILKATEDKYQAQLTNLQERVEKAEAQALDADEKRQKREYVEKAVQMRGLPANKLELADNLYKLAKAAPEQAEWFEGLLKTVDNQLGAAGIFAELGTNQTPEQLELMDEVEKAAKEVGSLEDALLSLPKEKQLALLNDMRGGK